MSEVTQADREAAARSRPFCGETAAGLRDGDVLVQAFARHRIAHSARSDAEPVALDTIAIAKARLSIAAVKARNRGEERGMVCVNADDIAVLVAAHSDLDRQLSATPAVSRAVDRGV